ncbi:MAG: GNAT family N-acetyltransferase [Proteobacteria bacterium]|nr:GNAT family N-acetyltransferase [Pseudomonadota bacterium]
MDIRQLEKDDLRALLDLYKHLHSSDDPLPSQSKIETVWAEIVSSEKLRYFGGFIGSELISSCTISVIPNLTRGCRPYGVIENVVTHSSHRKHGYGTALLRAALSHAWTLGCYKVMLLSGRKDEATLRFYQSAGFDPNGKQAFIAKPAA